MCQPLLYILHSPTLDVYYVGSTNDFERRFHEHTHYKRHFTAIAQDWKVVFLDPCETLKEARQKECWLKRQKSRQLIIQIIQQQMIKKRFQPYDTP